MRTRSKPCFHPQPRLQRGLHPIFFSALVDCRSPDIPALLAQQSQQNQHHWLFQGQGETVLPPCPRDTAKSQAEHVLLCPLGNIISCGSELHRLTLSSDSFFVSFKGDAFSFPEVAPCSHTMFCSSLPLTCHFNRPVGNIPLQFIKKQLFTECIHMSAALTE